MLWEKNVWGKAQKAHCSSFNYHRMLRRDLQNVRHSGVDHHYHHQQQHDDDADPYVRVEDVKDWVGSISLQHDPTWSNMIQHDPTWSWCWPVCEGWRCKGLGWLDISPPRPADDESLPDAQTRALRSPPWASRLLLQLLLRLFLRLLLRLSLRLFLRLLLKLFLRLLLRSPPWGSRLLRLGRGCWWTTGCQKLLSLIFGRILPTDIVCPFFRAVLRLGI